MLGKITEAVRNREVKREETVQQDFGCLRTAREKGMGVKKQI